MGRRAGLRPVRCRGHPPRGRARAAPARVTAQGALPQERLALLADRRDAGLRLGRAGRWEEAYEVHRAVAAERELLLGPHHPDTLAVRHELGRALGRLGRWEEALAEHRRLACVRAQTLGSADPATVASRNEEAHCLERLGRRSEADEVYRELARGR